MRTKKNENLQMKSGIWRRSWAPSPRKRFPPEKTTTNFWICSSFPRSNRSSMRGNFTPSTKPKKSTRENEIIQKAYLGTIRCLAVAADFKDQHTGEHLIRMGRYMAFLALRTGLSASEIKDILFVAPMHDIGKIGIPEAILNKPGKLTTDERRVMERHTLIGANILMGIDSNLLRLASQVALTHHERWDGQGYPRKLAGTGIPLVGRLAAIADVFDALTMIRPYKQVIPIDQACEIIQAERKKAFDPEVTDLFVQHQMPFHKSSIRSIRARKRGRNPNCWPRTKMNSWTG